MIRALALLAALACAPPALAAARWQPEETAVVAWTNAARRDLAGMCAVCKVMKPSIECAGWGAPGTLPPFHYEPVAAAAARFHAKHMHDGPCFQHESCCELAEAPDGTIRCATPQCSVCGDATSCVGTGMTARYELLGYAPITAENIAAGYRRSLEVVCGWLDSPGHRTNILGRHNDLGVGLVAAPGTCATHYWVQGFGSRRDLPSAGYITAGGIMPDSFGPPFGADGASATATAFVWDDVDDVAPRSVRAVVDGRCIALSSRLGANGRALFTESFDAAPGCHQAWFVAVDARGGRHVFPPEGALSFAIGDATCAPADTRVPASCEGADACEHEGARRACYTGPAGTENVGLCHGGASVCTDGAFAACAGEVAPVTEICNGLDDDCDGVADEHPSDVGVACGTGLPGRCAAGLTACVGGTSVCEPASEPIEETCNGEDDDCDGDADDGLGDVACGAGACRRIVAACRAGAPQACVPGVAQPGEICGNNVDDDCNGSPDDGCACAGLEERTCYVGPKETIRTGACTAGRQRCDGGLWGACDAQVVPQAEGCNGKDDDCDGAVDEGFGREACGTGACRATNARCVAGTLRTCTPLEPAAEQCNGRDDSCDGSIDEHCLCQAGATQPCATSWLHAGVGTCRAGVRHCDAHGAAWSACAGEVLPVTEQCGNALDDDCDGDVDEDCVTKPPPEVPEEERDRGCGCGGGSVDGALALPALLALLRRRRAGR